jgi:hypothetical protein
LSENADQKRTGRSTAVLLVDWDNFRSSCREIGIHPDPEIVVASVLGEGYRLIQSVIFTDVSHLTREIRTRLQSTGFNLRDCPKYHASADKPKDTVDSAMIDHMAFIADFVEADAVIIASRDRDFLPAIQRLRHGGVTVVAAMPAGMEQCMLSSCVDQCIAYGRKRDEHPSSGAVGNENGTAIVDPRTFVSQHTFGALRRSVTNGDAAHGYSEESPDVSQARADLERLIGFLGPLTKGKKLSFNEVKRRVFESGEYGTSPEYVGNLISVLVDTEALKRHEVLGPGSDPSVILKYYVLNEGHRFVVAIGKQYGLRTSASRPRKPSGLGFRRKKSPKQQKRHVA